MGFHFAARLAEQTTVFRVLQRMEMSRVNLEFAGRTCIWEVLLVYKERCTIDLEQFGVTFIVNYVAISML
jgi:hypothetical protein